ncbi:MAG: hypothetical protein WC058_11500 [Phycisphaeraceae bacterium]
MSETYINRHGRKPGRGLRPWLLIPKVLAVCCYFGSLVSMLAVWLVTPRSSSPPMGSILVIDNYITIPSLLIAMLLGFALVIHHGPVLLRMRWLQCKILLAVSLLFIHFQLEMSFLPRTPLKPLILALVAAMLIIWLGRHKPRLGQNIAAQKKR